MNELPSRRELDFLLYEFLDTASLAERERYRGQTRDVYDATIDAARAIAESSFAPFFAKGDAQEPTYDGSQVRIIPETKAAWDALREAGFLKAHCDEAEGGLQLPEVILRSAMAQFQAANWPAATYPFLTIGVINLIRAFGTEEQKRRWLPPLLEGDFSGTMALSQGRVPRSPTSAPGPSPDPTARTGSSARRCSSPPASTT